MARLQQVGESTAKGTVRARAPFREVTLTSSWFEFLAVTAALTMSGCSGDVRPLHLSVTLDAAAPALGGSPDGSAAGITIARDSGKVDYSSFLDSGRGEDAGLADQGPCVHTDLDGTKDCTNTLSSNSDFNQSLAGWSATSNAAVRWVPLDVQGASGSGSMAVKNVEQGDFDGETEAAATQCLTATPGSRYSYEAWTFIKHGQPFGNAQLDVWLFDQPNCAAAVSNNGAYALNSLDATDHWNLLRGGLTIPPTVHSMSVRLVSRKPYRNDSVEVLFDAVRVQKTN